MYVYIYIYIYIYVCICICMCMYVCMYVYIYIYTYTYVYNYMGFYFVCVMKLYSECVLLNGVSLGVTFVSPPHLAEQGGEEQTIYTQTCTVQRFCACRGRGQSRSRHMSVCKKRMGAQDPALETFTRVSSVLPSSYDLLFMCSL